MKTRVISIIFLLTAIGLAYFLVSRIKFAIDEEKRIEREFEENNAKLDKSEKDKLDYLRDSAKRTQEELRKQMDENFFQNGKISN